MWARERKRGGDGAGRLGAMPANPLNLDDFGGELYDLSMSEGARPLLDQVKTFIATEI